MKAKKSAATEARSFRTFLLMQQFAAREIGERIAQARREANAMTQEELAEALNLSTRALQDYEAGKRIPWKHFSRLEQIFKRDLDWFLHGEQESKPEFDDRLSEIDRKLTQALDELAKRDERLAAIEETLREVAAATRAA